MLPALDLPRLILALRPDLCRRFGFDRPEGSDAYLSWLLTTGVKEYKALTEDKVFLRGLHGHDPSNGLTVLQAAIYRARPDVQKAFPLPTRRNDFELWFYCHGVGEHKLWPWLSIDERAVAQTVAQQTQSPWLDALSNLAQSRARPAASAQTTKDLLWGVNLIGYAFGQLGIGEDLRMTARALKAAGVPLAIVNVAPGRHIPQSDLSLKAWVLPKGQAGPYRINLFCMTALETGRFYAEQGLSQFEARYNIGYWPWELAKWPDAWKLAHPLVDQVWVSTNHIADALRPAFDGPIHVMPLVVEPEPHSQRWRALDHRKRIRRKHRLPLSAHLFCFAFDLNSSMHRKNPQACVAAFLRAFPLGGLARGQVGLVIKTHAPQARNPAWEQLKALAAQDDRIHIIEGTLPRPDLMALYAACDVFVSLHRAEGFGRGLAEALQLGLHLITTDYSGNTDFCHRPEFVGQISRVPYRLVRVRKGQYPYADGQYWASPNLAAAARAMRACLQSPTLASEVPARGWPCFSARLLGGLYAKRLRQIAGRR